jgi:hypothetical protein
MIRANHCSFPRPYIPTLLRLQLWFATLAGLRFGSCQPRHTCLFDKELPPPVWLRTMVTPASASIPVVAAIHHRPPEPGNHCGDSTHPEAPRRETTAPERRVRWYARGKRYSWLFRPIPDPMVDRILRHKNHWRHWLLILGEHSSYSETSTILIPWSHCPPS